MIAYNKKITYFFLIKTDPAQHKDPDAAELVACEDAGPVHEVPGEWIQV